MSKKWHADAQGDFQICQICFVKLLYIPCPWGIGEHDHLRHVTKFGTKIWHKSSPADAICITETSASYWNILRTYVTYWRKPHVSICNRFCTIQVQSWEYLSKFAYFRAKIEQKKVNFRYRKWPYHAVFMIFGKNRHETFPNNILGILIERIGWILFR